MRNRDVESIRKNVKGIEAISPVIWGNRSDKNVAYGQVSGTYNVKGIYPDYFKIESQDIFFGRLLNDIDHNSRRKVCNIGKKVCDELFFGHNILVIIYIVFGSTVKHILPCSYRDWETDRKSVV